MSWEEFEHWYTIDEALEVVRDIAIVGGVTQYLARGYPDRAGKRRPAEVARAVVVAKRFLDECRAELYRMGPDTLSECAPLLRAEMESWGACGASRERAEAAYEAGYAEEGAPS